MPQIKNLFFILIATFLVVAHAKADDFAEASKFTPEGSVAAQAKVDAENAKAADNCKSNDDPNACPKAKQVMSGDCSCVECAAALGLKCDQTVESYNAISSPTLQDASGKTAAPTTVVH